MEYIDSAIIMAYNIFMIEIVFWPAVIAAARYTAKQQRGATIYFDK